MPSVLASDDQPIPNAAAAAAESGEKGATESDEALIDLNGQRIRVVRDELSQSPNAVC